LYFDQRTVDRSDAAGGVGIQFSDRRFHLADLGGMEIVKINGQTLGIYSISVDKPLFRQLEFWR